MDVYKTIVGTQIYPLQNIEEGLYNANPINNPVEIVLNEPIIATDIHPIHPMYSIASNCIDIEHNMLPQEINLLPQEMVVLEPTQQKCCVCCCSSLPLHPVITKENCCMTCSSLVISLGLVLFIVSVFK